MKLKLSGISKSYGPHHVLRDISLQLDDIRALTIIGPSGGGKSTLLRVIAGLEVPDSGAMEINGEPVPFDDRSLLRYRRTIGTVFQAYNLFPHLTALENITLPLEKVHRLSDEEAERRAFDLLVRFRLEEHSHKKPGQMSGGQKQRVAIARALAIRPRFLLFDEPTSALDPEMTAEVLDIVEELLRDSCDVIIVTHQMAFAQRFSDHVLFIAGGQVAESGTTTEIFENPQSVDLVRFLRKTLRY